MEYEVIVAGAAGDERALLVEAPDGATVGALRRAVADAAGPAGAKLFLGPVALGDDQRLADVLLPGVQLSIGRPAPGPAPACTVREVAVVGGAAAGRTVPLPDAPADGLTARPVTIGRLGGDLALDDPEVSRRHARLHAASDGVWLRDLGSRNGVAWRGYRVTGDVRLDDGDTARVGETMVTVRRRTAADARLEPDPAHGVRRFNRPPRILPPGRQPVISVPAAPERPRGIRIPFAVVLLPLLLAGVAYRLIPNAGYYLIFLALSPLLAIAHVVTERRNGRREYREKQREYESALAAVQAELAELALADERAARLALPDPAATMSIATGPTGRLFERRPGDADFGRLRIGLTDRPAAVRLTGPGADATAVPVAYAVPLAADLAAGGVLGVAGPRRSVLGVARALLAQAATLHAPHDLGVVLLTGADEAADWTWATWLPHTLPHTADLACRRMVATDREQAEARVAELGRMLAERRAEQSSGLRAQAPPGRRLLVLLDGARRLRTVTGLAPVLTDGPALGVYAICLDAAESDLPDECRTTVVVTGVSGSRARVRRPGTDPEPDVLLDMLAAPLAERLARALAPVRVLGARLGVDGDLPERVRYLDIAGLGDRPRPADVLARWSANPGGRSTEVLLGADAAGPVTVDLRRDGPHALIAGTSGSGKSELLQTLVASLALGNAPDALNLVLVDYKGGSAFAACRDLPHCVGMITDLDGHLAHRALASLSAEIRRREGILAGAGAKDIEDYWATTGGRLPRLVIVVDEFATLVEDVPDFVSGVIDIGMRGRSLGVHLVLATQRPGGVVSAEIRANVNLRLCLRVTRAEESADVVDVPDAARISRLYPGRAYLRTGHSDLAVVQCARIGWPRTGAAPSTSDDVTVTGRRTADLGRPRAIGPAGAATGHDGDTDLTELVAAVRAAAEASDAAAPASPWLPPLPDRVTVADLDAFPRTGTTAAPVAVPLGLADLPDAQAQVPFLLDLDRTGPVVIAGMARSGRSTTLRTLAASLALASSPADVHLYLLDYGSRALAPLAGLPHCGAVADGDEPDRVERVLGLLTAEVSRRAEVLAAARCGSIREQRAAAAPHDRLPYLVLLLDRYETFVDRHAEADGGRLVDVLDGLLRGGPTVGITPVLATDRSGFTRRLGNAVATRLVLRQADPDDVAIFGADPRSTPRSLPDGRAVVVPAGTHVQVALLAPDPDGAAQSAALDELAAELRDRWAAVDRDRLPRRVDRLPRRITAADLAALRSGPPPRTPAGCTVGAGGDQLAPVDVDLAGIGATFLVSGPPRSGRSTALAAIVTSLAGRASGELPVLLWCPRPSPVADLADLPGVVAVLRGPDAGADLEDAVDSVPGPVAIVVDDCELVSDGAGADALAQITRAARDTGNLVVAAGTTDDLMVHRYGGWLTTIRRGRCGLLLNPSSNIDGEVFDLKLPRSVRGGWPPGRALLVQRGSTTAVQVPAEPAGLDVDRRPVVASR